MPSSLRPQLSTLVDRPPAGNSWLHEIKFDGYRLIAFIHQKKIKFMTRNQHDWTSKFPMLKKDMAKLKLDTAILDGELVAINQEQQFDFQLLQNSIHDKNTTALIYYVFDLIYYNGYDLTSVPLLERKQLLKELIPNDASSSIRYCDHVIGDGEDVYKKACEFGLEGIISKAVDSAYVQKRTRYWLKIKCTQRQEFIVGGFTKPGGHRRYFGSLLVGVYSSHHKLTYCGHVGTGFNEKTLKHMGQWLEANTISNMPFASLPEDVKRANWVKPKLVIEVEFRGWTQDKILRQPSCKGLRKDKSPKEIMLETAQPKKAIKSKTTKDNESMPDFPLTNPDRILYAEQGITKLQLAEFYANIRAWILPYIINRPLTLLRCPHGDHSKCFYQKHLTETSLKSIYSIQIKEKHHHQPYLYIKDEEGLMALVQLGVLEIHPWGSRIDDVEKPDVIVFDLDPAPDVAWKKVIEAACFIRDQLEQLNLVSFVKTTGGKGLHVSVPIKRQYSWDEIKAYSQAFVKYMVSLQPDNFVDVMTKAKRSGKIYLDYLRNQKGATSIASYSTRATSGATVSTPLRWEELSTKIKSDTYTIENLHKRLEKLKSDPWENFFDLHQVLKM